MDSLPPPPVPGPRPTTDDSADHDLPRDPADTADRLRRIELPALGGAVVGALIGIIMAGSTELSSRQRYVVLGAAVAMGFAIGGVLGRTVRGLLAKRLAATSGRRAALAWILVATPVYLVAGLVAWATGLYFGGGAIEAHRGDLVGVALGLLVVWGIVGPVTLAYAPTRSGRSTTMQGRLAGCSGTAWVIGFAVLWVIGSFMAVMLLLAAVAAVVPEGYQAMADAGLLTVPVLGGWLGLWLAGIMVVRRFIRARLLAKARGTPGG